MAWYLSEVVTDLSPLQEVLTLFEQTGYFPKDDYIDEYQRRLTRLLRQATFNADHIDAIPVEYENDQYKWLASDFFYLTDRLGLIDGYCDEPNSQWSIILTERGKRIVNREITTADLMHLALPEWRNDQNAKPYQKIIDTASELKQQKLYPCGGLLLLEVLLILLQLNKLYGYALSPYEVVYRKRKEYYPFMTGDLRIDLIDYSGFLWEQLSQELSNYHAANYPARATLLLMMHGGDLIYGYVPDEIFGLVQYVTVA